MAQIKAAAKLTPAKKKQLILIGAGAGVIVVLSLVAGIIADSNRGKKTSTDDEKLTPINLNVPTPGQQLSDTDVWRANEGAKIEALSKELQDLRTKAENPVVRNQMPPALAAGMSSPSTGSDMPLPPPPPMPTTSRVQSDQPDMAENGHRRGGTQGQPEVPVRRTFSLEVPGSKPLSPAPGASDASSEQPASPGQSAAKTADTYLPAGSFLRVALLSGLDAPTGGQAQNNPHPLIMRVLDAAQLPNRFRSDVRDCVVTGNGYGDISSERAYVRLDRLSCIRQDGGAVDVALKGYIAGEDGKAGMRGRLISKQGQALANAFLAGIGSGIGQAFRDSSTTQSTSALGTTATVTQGKELEAGLGAGVGSAMQQLSKYYIKLAEQIFPVIEIDGGRVVDVVLTRGATLEMKNDSSWRQAR